MRDLSKMGVIILVREVAVAAMTANVVNALVASLGVTLLVVALWVSKEKIVSPLRERAGSARGSE